MKLLHNKAEAECQVDRMFTNDNQIQKNKKSTLESSRKSLIKQVMKRERERKERIVVLRVRKK